MAPGPWYATREQVKGASDIKETARLNRAIDRNLARAAREAEAYLGLLHLYPVQETRYFDWPDSRQDDPWDLWLGANRLISLTAATSGGQALTIATDLFLEPSASGPPYNRVRINSESQASWSSGASGWQRSIALTGLWGDSDVTESSGTLTQAIGDTTGTSVYVSDGVTIGVGDLIAVDAERMVVTDKWLTDSGVNSSGALTSEKTSQLLAVPNGGAFTAGEVILIDAERMRVDDIAGNNLIVVRAIDGTTLAAHSTNADIYVQRRLIVRRGFGGTTAATHLVSAAVSRWVPPQTLNELVLAETQNAIAQESASWARTIGIGEAVRESWAKGLVDLRKTALRTLGNSARKAAI